MLKYLCVVLVVISWLSAIGAGATATYQTNRLGFLPGDGWSEAVHINDSAVILGRSISLNNLSNDTRGACLWSTSGIVNIRVNDQLDFANDINDQGQIVGMSDAGYGPHEAYLRQSNGELVELDPLTESTYLTDACAINDKGWIVGCSAGSAVLWQNSTVAQVIGGGADSQATATDVNNNGSIAWSNSFHAGSQWVTKAYVWNQGRNTVLQSLNPSENCWTASMNDSGIIVGKSGDHAVAWRSDGSILFDLGIGSAYGINNHGQIVGVQNDRAVLWNSDGSIAADLSGLVGTNTPSIARSINDSGQIVGVVEDSDHLYSEAVLWQPVPEPSSILTLLAGIAGLGGFTLKRKRS